MGLKEKTVCALLRERMKSFQEKMEFTLRMMKMKLLDLSI